MAGAAGGAGCRRFAATYALRASRCMAGATRAAYSAARMARIFGKRGWFGVSRAATAAVRISCAQHCALRCRAGWLAARHARCGAAHCLHRGMPRSYTTCRSMACDIPLLLLLHAGIEPGKTATAAARPSDVLAAALTATRARPA